MMMQPLITLTSRVVFLPVNDVDTDQIIPARFLKTIDKVGLGANLFADWRYLPDGNPDLNFVLNKPESQGAQVLLAGHNFGCGSSREHAPWALVSYGFRVVIATSFADIFHNNALKNGLLPLVVELDAHRRLVQILQERPQSAVTIDLPSQTLLIPGGQRIRFPIDGFSKTCLLKGIDELGYLLGLEEEISAFERTRVQVLP